MYTDVEESTPDFRLNLLQVTLSGTQFPANTVPFNSSEQLRTLRTHYSTTHTIQRQGNQVFCVPLFPNAPMLGEACTIQVDDEPALVCKLIREALLRFLGKIGYTFTKFNPIRFVTRRPQRDILATAMNIVKAPPIRHLHVYPEYVFSPRFFSSRFESPIFGIQVDTKVHGEIDCPIATLVQQGLNPKNYYVRAKNQAAQIADPRRDPMTYLHPVGRVHAMIDNRLLLEDAPELTEVQAEQAWLEADFENIELCLGLAGVMNVAKVMQQLRKEVFSQVGAKGRFEYLCNIARWMQQQDSFLLADGLSCSIHEPSSSFGMDAGLYRQFTAPEFVFNPAGSKTHSQSSKGLQEFGPFDTESFSHKNPHIVVVTPKAYQGGIISERWGSRGMEGRRFCRVHAKGDRGKPDHLSRVGIFMRPPEKRKERPGWSAASVSFALA